MPRTDTDKRKSGALQVAEPPAAAEPQPESLDKVRDILFGTQMRAVEGRLQGLEERLRQEHESLRADFSKQVESLDAFIRGEVQGMGRDFCDMSGPYGRAFEDFNLVNAVLPSKYEPVLRDNVFERRATSIARQLIGADATLDYDQFLAKRPARPAAVFAWHQDLGYWPTGTPDTLTVTCSPSTIATRSSPVMVSLIWAFSRGGP